jgi:hypothetical protein
MWKQLMSMLISPDVESRNLAMGMLEGIDYLNQDQMSSNSQKFYNRVKLTNNVSL